MYQIFEKLIQKRNKEFKLSKNITNKIIFIYLAYILRCKIRGYLVCFKHLRYIQQLFLEQKVEFRYFHNIKIGKYVIIEKYSTLSSLATAGLTIGNNVRIGAFGSIHVSKNYRDITGYINLGDNVGIGEYCSLGGTGGLTIGKNCIIGAYFSCHPEDHNFNDTSKLIKDQGVNRKGITIGENCWIGAKVTILDGAKIGSGCVIAAGSVVKGEYPDYCVIGGVPSRIIKEIKP